MHALIDGDVLVYASAFAAQKTVYHWEGNAFAGMDAVKTFAEEQGLDVKEMKKTGKLLSQVQVFDEDIALLILRNKVMDIMKWTKATSNNIYLTGRGNFRDAIAETKGYKANRKDKEKPVHYALMRDTLISKYDADVVDHEEADDAMGYAQMRMTGTCICSIDKDMNQIPGRHFDWGKELRYTVSPPDALYFFHHQLLTGDATDNIPGVPGLGEKKATKLLTEVRPDPKAQWEIVKSTYGDNGLDHNYLQEMMQLLWIRREPDEMTTPKRHEEVYIGK